MQMSCNGMADEQEVLESNLDKDMKLIFWFIGNMYVCSWGFIEDINEKEIANRMGYPLRKVHRLVQELRNRELINESVRAYP